MSDFTRLCVKARAALRVPSRHIGKPFRSRRDTLTGLVELHGPSIHVLAALAFSATLAGGTADAASAVEAEHGMVVSSHRLASEVGVRVLVTGGNAIDAAVAVCYALAVVDPCCGNIGGGGF
jgi:hypothetical protein